MTSFNERARVNVTRVVRAAIERSATADPMLGQHFSRTIRTGGFCSYDPDPAASLDWKL